MNVHSVGCRCYDCCYDSLDTLFRLAQAQIAAKQRVIPFIYDLLDDYEILNMDDAQINDLHRRYSNVYTELQNLGIPIPRYTSINNLEKLLEEKKMTLPGKKSNVYIVYIESRFVLTQTQLKDALGLGYRILSIEMEKDVESSSKGEMINVDSAALQIIQTGYRALARANHPDLGGDENVMKILNQSKRELVDLIKSLEEK